MAHDVFIRPAAAADLDTLYDHVAAHSPEHAIAFIRRIRQRRLALADFPMAGRARNDLRPGLRLIALERRIFCGGRDVDASLSEAGPED